MQTIWNGSMLDQGPLLIAHRGASHEAPENTLAAFDLAWCEGADGIEADFRLSGEGAIVCIHDPGTGRTAGVDLVVAETSLAQLRRLDVGSWKGKRWQSERIPTLAEVLDRLPAGKRLYIELKSGPEIVTPLRTILAASNVPAAALRLLTFSAPLIAQLKEALPEIRTCLNLDYRRSLRTGLRLRPAREEILAVLAACDADGLSSRAHPLLDRAFVAAIHQSGRELHVWTVDSPRKAGYYRELGVDSLMTNRPGRLRQHRDAVILPREPAR